MSDTIVGDGLKGKMTPNDEVEHKFRFKAWWVVKETLLFVCLFFGLVYLQSFLIHSFEVSGINGISARRDQYDRARTYQVLTLLLFLGCQVLGGTLLRSLVRRSTSDRWGRIQGVLLFSLGFALVTGLVATAIVHVDY
jgi:hypothetical protein